MNPRSISFVLAGALLTSVSLGGADPQRTKLAEEAWKAREAASKLQTTVASAETTIAKKTAAIAEAEKKLAAAKTDAERTSIQKTISKATTDRSGAEKTVATNKAAMDAALDAAAVAHAKALGGLAPIATKDWDYTKARHLLSRAGFGAPPEEVERLVKLGPHRAVAELVEYRELPLANIDPEKELYSWERPLAYEKLLPESVQARIAEEVGEQRNVLGHAVMIRWWVRRMLETPRPLEEKLVLFWHDHFASSYRTLGDTYLMYQQNQLFRRYADNYEALLHGVVEDPAIIRYLNNDENVAGNTNENLGRELLELFTLGEENCVAHKADGYSEKDVRDANTRSLTGATFEHYSGQHRFYVTKHDGRPKTLLGKTGDWGPHEAVDIMLEHPGTARYLAKKLWQFFVSWEPDSATIEQLATVLRENGYTIRPLLRHIFLSQEFYSDKAMGRHIKSPVELLVGTARVMQLPKVDYQNVRFLLASTGQNLFDPPSVAGWAEGTDWVNTTLLMGRYSAVAELIKQTKPDLVALLQEQKLQTATDVVDYFTRRCLFVELSAEKRQELIGFLGELPPSSEWAKQQKEVNAKLVALLVLLTTSPEYQLS